MISENMYKILKQIPRFPQRITFKEISDKRLLDISLLSNLLDTAIDNNYIAFFGRNALSDLHRSSFYLTEAGRQEIEEYKRQICSNKKATLAIIIAGLSFVASVVAIFK